MDERFERTMYLRDMRVNGDVYKGNVSVKRFVLI